MGAAIDALGDGIDIAKRNPNLVLGSAMTMLLLFGVGGLLSFIPLVGPLVTNVVVAPVALAGLVAMANAGASGSASFGDFTDGVGDHSVSLMGAYALLFVIQMGIGFLLLIGIFVAGIGTMSAAGAQDPTAMAGALGGTVLLVGLVVVLLYLVVALVTQFLDVAVVVGDADAAGSFSEAVDLVTSGPLSVLGYSLLRGVVALVAIGVPVGVGAVAIGFGVDAGQTAAIAAGVLLVVVAFPVGFAFLYAYHVAYYRRRTGVPA